MCNIANPIPSECLTILKGSFGLYLCAGDRLIQGSVYDLFWALPSTEEMLEMFLIPLRQQGEPNLGQSLRQNIIYFLFKVLLSTCESNWVVRYHLSHRTVTTWTCLFITFVSSPFPLFHTLKFGVSSRACPLGPEADIPFHGAWSPLPPLQVSSPASFSLWSFLVFCGSLPSTLPVFLVFCMGCRLV